MPKKREYGRVTITLPTETLRQADRLARDADRPRSWVIAEAVRQYATRRPSATPPHGVESGLGYSRRQQLVADLALTPEQRVLAAEETARATASRAPSVQRVIAFDRFEDYLAYKNLSRVGR